MSGCAAEVSQRIAEAVFADQEAPMHQGGFGQYQEIYAARVKDPAVMAVAQDGGVVTALLLHALRSGRIVHIDTPKTIADQMEEWFKAPACDGFVLAATHMPGNYEDFVRLLVPELQRRGLRGNRRCGRSQRHGNDENKTMHLLSGFPQIGDHIRELIGSLQAGIGHPGVGHLALGVLQVVGERSIIPDDARLLHRIR